MPDSKNIVFIATSLDGYIAGPNGELDWLEMIPNLDHMDMGFVSLMNEVDAVVMGRTTYETVVGFGGEWPYSKHVYVLSTSLKSVPTNLADKVSILRGSPSEILTKIHERGHHTLYIDGGRTIQDFLRSDLIDELVVSTMPVLLGGGFPLFGELSHRQEYELVESKVYLHQIVQNRYRRKR